MIREIPSNVFNETLDIWLRRSMGEKVYKDCPYCEIFRSHCSFCPLNKKNICNADDGLYWKWVYSKNINKKKGMYYADKIIDIIIETCVYET